jgi:hypothetical protein
MTPENDPNNSNIQNPANPEEIEQSTQVLLAFITYQWSQAKQSEDQRAAITNFLLTIAIALQGFIVQRGFDIASIVLAVLITLLGGFGIVTSAKYYERFRNATNRVGEVSKYLDKLHPASRLRELQKISDIEHQQRFPRMSQLRLNRLWLILHCLVIAFGLSNIIIIILVNR